MALSDDDLVAAFIASGSRTAFHELVRRHHAAIRSLLRRLCRDAALADDLAQDTFMKALANARSYGGGGRFRSWLGGIAYREFLMSVRNAKRRQRLHADAARESHGDDRDTRPDVSVDLDRALAQLPEAERTAVVLNYACGMSHIEISRAMQIPLGTVKTFIDRSRKTLFQMLSAEQPT